MRKLGLLMVLFALCGFVVGCGGEEAKDKNKKGDGEKKKTDTPEKKDDTAKPDDTPKGDDTTNGKTDEPPIDDGSTTDDGTTTDVGTTDPPTETADGEKPKSSLKSIFGALRKGAEDGIKGDGN